MKTEIICLIDCSGSMRESIDATVEGINAFVGDQRRAPGNARMTLAVFNETYEVRWAGRPLDQVPVLDDHDLQAEGGTALFDAIGLLLLDQTARIRHEGWADRVIVCILTDGEDMDSFQFESRQIRAMVRRLERRGAWKFVFLAANQDAFTTGARCGFDRATTGSFESTQAGALSAFADFSETTFLLRRSSFIPGSSHSGLI